MAVRTGINGFGRIGRLFYHIAAERGVDVVAVNDIVPADNLAYLLKYDTIHGRFLLDSKPAEVSTSKSSFTVNGRKTEALSVKNPAQLPWKSLDVDYVLESTGLFTDYEQASGHLKAGAHRVIISAPTKSSPEQVPTLCLGVNQDLYDPRRQEGDRVGIPWLHTACGYCSYCRIGWETLCGSQLNSGYSVNGSFAEYALADLNYVGRLPNSLEWGPAAPILCAGVTVYKGLKETEVKPGQWVVISGIGGLGHMAVQYAKAMGMRVAAVDMHADKLELAKSLGVDQRAVEACRLALRNGSRAGKIRQANCSPTSKRIRRSYRPDVRRPRLSASERQEARQDYANDVREDWRDYADDHYYHGGGYYYGGLQAGGVVAGMAIGSMMTAASFSAQASSCSAVSTA
jgi:threonine dehydrogenase-like Zn-dependent dehydrogenase